MTSEATHRLSELLDELERELFSLPVAQALQQRELSPELTRTAVRALKLYLAGDVDVAAQSFEAMAEDLRDRTLSIRPRDES